MAKKVIEKKETKKVEKEAPKKSVKASPKKEEPKKVAKKEEPKKARKEVAKKEEPKKEEPIEKTAKAYHVSKREDGKWQVKLAKGKVAIKLFNTKAEALEYTLAMSKNQDASVRFHASKGVNKGKIRKL